MRQEIIDNIVCNLDIEILPDHIFKQIEDHSKYANRKCIKDVFILRSPDYIVHNYFISVNLTNKQDICNLSYIAKKYMLLDDKIRKHIKESLLETIRKM